MAKDMSKAQFEAALEKHGFKRGGPNSTLWYPPEGSGGGWGVSAHEKDAESYRSRLKRALKMLEQRQAEVAEARRRNTLAKAAPDLLAALEGLESAASFMRARETAEGKAIAETWTPLIVAARAALVKARGHEVKVYHQTVMCSRCGNPAFDHSGIEPHAPSADDICYECLVIAEAKGEA